MSHVPAPYGASGTDAFRGRFRVDGDAVSIRLGSVAIDPRDVSLSAADLRGFAVRDELAGYMSLPTTADWEHRVPVVYSHPSVTLGIYGYGTRSDESVAEAVNSLLDGTNSTG